MQHCLNMSLNTGPKMTTRQWPASLSRVHFTIGNFNFNFHCFFSYRILTFRVLLKKQLASASFFMFIVLIVSICVTLIDQLCSSILLGFQKFGSMAIISIISRLVSILVIIIGLLLHYKIQVLVFCQYCNGGNHVIIAFLFLL